MINIKCCYGINSDQKYYASISKHLVDIDDSLELGRGKNW